MNIWAKGSDADSGNPGAMDPLGPETPVTNPGVDDDIRPPVIDGDSGNPDAIDPGG